MRLPWLRPKNQPLAELLRFLDDGEVSPRLHGLRMELGRMELRYAIARLATWLECQADPGTVERPPSERSLLIDPKYQWCQNLQRVFEEFEELGRFFRVVDGELAWSEEIDFKEQLALARQVTRRRRRG